MKTCSYYAEYPLTLRHQRDGVQVTLPQISIFRMEISYDFWVLLTKLSQKNIGRLKFKICGNVYSLLTQFEPSVPFHIDARHDLQCKPNNCFYVKYNTRLKQHNTTPFLLKNYLLNCAQHMLDVFSTEKSINSLLKYLQV